MTYPGNMVGIPHHTGILTFHIASGLWKWTREYFLVGHQLYPPTQPFSVEGLVYGVASIWGDVPYSHKVYDFQTNTTGRPCAIGMVVDSSFVHYVFRVIYGSTHDPTQIYDSETRSLETKLSFVDVAPEKRALCKSCLHLVTCGQDSGVFYERDGVSLNLPQVWGLDLGLGKVRFYLINEGMVTITVWRRFAHVPSELQAWLVPPGFQADDTIRAFANFCSMYSYMRCWLEALERERNVPLNLVTKQWEKMDVSNPDT